MTRIVRALHIASLFCVFSLPALAQTQLERMEDLGERAGELTNRALIMQVPALEGNLPDPSWDDNLRTAFDCVLSGYNDAAGTSAVDQMLDEMEAALEVATPETVLSGEMERMVDLPAGVDEAMGQALMAQCGVMEIMMARMTESGAMSIMMDQ